LTLERLAAQMRELQAQVQGKRPVVSRGHPFAEDVLGRDLPSNFRELSLSYDGSADPARHLRSFDNIVVLHRYSDAVSCRAFLTTLKGSAQDWFHQLPAGSIDCFEKFSSLFLNQFASARKHEKTYLSLINMQQKEGETLRQYVARYTKECVEVPSASEEIKAGGLTRGLRPGKCRDSLAKRPSRSFDELLERCNKFVNMEESEADFLRSDKTKIKQVEEKPRQGDRRTAPKESRVEHRFRGPRYEHYRQLNAPKQEILETMEKRGEEKLLAQPKPLPPPRKFSASKDRYCRYHRDFVLTADGVRCEGRADPHCPLRLSGSEVRPVGEVSLTVALGRSPLRMVKMVRFLVVDASSAYNIILGRPSLNSFQAAVSTYCMKIKFPVGDEVGEVTGDQLQSRRCYEVTLKTAEAQHKRKNDNLPECSRREKKQELGISSQDELMEVELIEGNPEKTTKVGRHLAVDLQGALIALLKEFVDVFAFSADDLTGIDPGVAEHRLNIDPTVRPVKQKRRHFGAELDVVIEAEVEKLLKAGHVQPIQFPEWLSNSVMVRKGEGKWRMCIDFRDLNKACPKDHYPLPRIDQLVDSTAGCELLSMMDASQGYHQIPLAVEDQKRVSFVTSKGTYCYVVMPFGLKNAGATYQRLVDRMFKGQIGRNMEVYVDDMLVKSKKADDHVVDLRETLNTLRLYGMKLNPTKCKFGVRSGKFLGYLVTERGIEVNPEKVRAVIEMQPPRNLREVQILTGRLAGLSRFIAQSAEKSFPFFKELKKGSRFEWTSQAQHAFERLKEFLAELPLLTKPEPGDTLVVYLSVGHEAISSVLIKEEHGQQKPIYYASRILQGAERRYSDVEKAALTLISTARKLRPYFLVHKVMVRTNYPLKDTMGRPSASGRMVKWAVELGEYNVDFEVRKAIKAQALADFIQECTLGDEKGPWMVYVDGSSAIGGA
ncbi:Unknown protein, partial [Striga hermonthica]